MKTTNTNTYEWYLFIVINKKIGGERKMSWLEFIEWLRHMAGIQKNRDVIKERVDYIFYL